MKVYGEQNVYDAANERIDYVFNNFERIYLSFSGGKDSGVMLNLVMDYMRKNGINRKIGVLFVDMEGQYKSTIDYINLELEKNKDLIDPYWVCLPINLRNAVSVFQPFWTPWDKEHKDKWIREIPSCAIHDDNNPFDFWRDRMEFEGFVSAFGEWYSQGQKTACLVGIRSDESLNRYRTIASRDKRMLDGKQWTTKVSDNVYNIYPVYDWATEDIWTGNGRMGWDYNTLYDLFYRSGVPLSSQRICQPYGDDQRIGLSLFRVVEPETWHKVVNRVSGANFGNIYCGDKIMGYRKTTLPKGHTWKSYTKLLLNTLPPELKRHYTERFVKFMRYWSRTGSPYIKEHEGLLPPEAIKTGRTTTRGHKDKECIIYKRIPDYIDGKAESDKLAPTWRRMAICILKNDHLCKTLSFTQTKDQQKKISDMLEKYRSL